MLRGPRPALQGARAEPARTWRSPRARPKACRKGCASRVGPRSLRPTSARAPSLRSGSASGRPR
eukprot:6990378-Alexandrium_andersonii.AAC.1